MCENVEDNQSYEILTGLPCKRLGLCDKLLNYVCRELLVSY